MGEVQSLHDYLKGLDQQIGEKEEGDECAGTHTGVSTDEHARHDQHRSEQPGEHLGGREERVREAVGHELDPESPFQRLGHLRLRRLLCSVSPDDRDRRRGLAQDSERTANLVADLVVVLGQDPLKPSHHDQVDDYETQSDQGETPLIEDHHAHGQQDLAETDDEPDPSPLHELLEC